MAEVRIEEAPVSRVFHEGKGAEIAESWISRAGEPVTQRWACWFGSAHGLSEGDIVTVVGRVGVKVDEWTDKEGNTRHTAKLSINDAKVIGSPSPLDEMFPGTKAALDNLTVRQSEVQTPTWDDNPDAPF